MKEDGRREQALRLLRRLGWGAFTIWGVTLVTFLVLVRMPADPAVALAGPTGSGDPAILAAIRARLKLDRSLPEQYLAYAGGLARGDLGESYVKGVPVTRAIGEALPRTVLLGGVAWVCWLVGGVTIGLLVSARPTRAGKSLLFALSVIGASTPSFWLGLVLLSVFAAWLGWLPAGGAGTARHLVLPVLTLSLSGIAFYARLSHSAMTETLQQDYVRTARAKGVAEGMVLWRHALRTAMIPLVTMAGVDLAALLGGVVFTETVFGWNGMGQLAVESVSSLDIPVVLGIVLVSAVFVVLTNLAVDLVLPFLDPRLGTEST